MAKLMPDDFMQEKLEVETAEEMSIPRVAWAYWT